MVTRCPIILQLIKEDGDETWGEFPGLTPALATPQPTATPTKRYNFQEIRAVLRSEFGHIAAGEDKVCAAPIVLRIHSPTALPLTLVDTPGLTRLAVERQPHDMAKRVREVVCALSGRWYVSRV